MPSSTATTAVATALQASNVARRSTGRQFTSSPYADAERNPLVVARVEAGAEYERRKVGKRKKKDREI